jgi:demethylmenaquinone methyltransferase/2-methoxy-6-polyprenyl-1,4-benzoquinol methylase
MAIYAHDKVVPDVSSDAAKKTQVAAMFDSIAGKYDFMNHFLSAGIDKSWRRKAIKELKKNQPKSILDVQQELAILLLQPIQFCSLIK